MTCQKKDNLAIDDERSKIVLLHYCNTPALQYRNGLQGFLAMRVNRSMLGLSNSLEIGNTVDESMVHSFTKIKALISGAFCNRLMYKNKKIVVVMPAYNASQTLQATYDEVMEQDVVDLVIVVDDGSRDETAAIAKTLPNTIVQIHPRNQGYGANQKTCYKLAIDHGGDVIIMVHPDYQYTPQLIPAMVSMIGSGLYHCVLGSRILGGYALKGGMPVWKYIANRFLTFVENILLGAKLSEYHTGYRAFSRELLERIPFDTNSDDFVFDNQILAQILWLGYKVGEISCPTKYFAEASSINFWSSMKYFMDCLMTALSFRLAKMKLLQPKLFVQDT